MPQKKHNIYVTHQRWRQMAFVSIAIALVLTVFNVFYFFVWRGVGPQYYIEKMFAQKQNGIDQEPHYSAMQEAYHHFNDTQGNSVVHVFIGDSITSGFDLHEFQPVGSRPVLNRGIYSDTTEGLLGRIETNVNNLKIEKLFVMIGYNDLDLKTDDEIVLLLLTINEQHFPDYFDSVV